MENRLPVISNDVSPNRNIISSLADELKFSGRFHELEFELLKLGGKKVNKKELESWYHYYGFAALVKEDHIEACKRLEVGLSLLPGSQNIMYLLAREYLYLKEIKKAFILFDQCHYPKVDIKTVLNMARFAYLYNEYEKGASYVKEILKFWILNKKIEIDGTGIEKGKIVRSVLRTFAALSILAGRKDDFFSLIFSFNEKFDEYEIDEIYLEVKSCIKNDYSIFIDNLKKDNMEKNIDKDLKISVFTSYMEDEYDSSMGIIDSINVKEEEYPVLEDLKYVVLARIADKFNSEDEDFLIEEFLKYQPMLFAPDQALEFGVLDYQEKLKSRVSFFNKKD